MGGFQRTKNNSLEKLHWCAEKAKVYETDGAELLHEVKVQGDLGELPG